MQIPRNILLTCTVNLGDVVLATSAASLIKQQLPSCRVSMLVKEGIGEILQMHPDIDEVISLKSKAKSREWKPMWQLVQELRARNFDMSISLDRKLRPALLTLLAGIAVRIGPDKVFDYKPSRVTWLYSRVVRTPKDFLHMHQAEIFQAIIKETLGIEGKIWPKLGPIATEGILKGKEFLASLPTGRKKIALCIRGTYALRNWPVEKFSQLIGRLAAKHDASFFIVGDGADWKDAEKVCRQVKIDVLNLCGKTTLSELRGVLAESDLFITIDTGSMHIAATMNVPTVGIFRCATQWRWAPLSLKAKVVSGRVVCNLIDRPEQCPVEPCPSLEGKTLYPCVEAIEIEQVELAADELLYGQ